MRFNEPPPTLAQSSSTSALLVVSTEQNICDLSNILVTENGSIMTVIGPSEIYETGEIRGNRGWRERGGGASLLGERERAP